jgi:hypothetical protein
MAGAAAAGDYDDAPEPQNRAVRGAGVRLAQPRADLSAKIRDRRRMRTSLR